MSDAWMDSEYASGLAMAAYELKHIEWIFWYMELSFLLETLYLILKNHPQKIWEKKNFQQKVPTKFDFLSYSPLLTCLGTAYQSANQFVWH